MKVKEVIEALSYYDGDDNITFYFLKNDTLILLSYKLVVVIIKYNVSDSLSVK